MNESVSPSEQVRAAKRAASGKNRPTRIDRKAANIRLAAKNYRILPAYDEYVRRALESESLKSASLAEASAAYQAEMRRSTREATEALQEEINALVRSLTASINSADQTVRREQIAKALEMSIKAEDENARVGIIHMLRLCVGSALIGTLVFAVASSWTAHSELFQATGAVLGALSYLIFVRRRKAHQPSLNR